VALEELGVSIDRRERVAHIVGYRACHPADCRHPIYFFQLAFRTQLRLVSQIETNAIIKNETTAAI
jgi:hypothetical protein